MIWNSTSHLSQLIKSVTVLQTVRLCQESHHETSFIEDSKRNVGVFFFFFFQTSNSHVRVAQLHLNRIPAGKNPAQRFQQLSLSLTAPGLSKR